MNTENKAADIRTGDITGAGIIVGKDIHIGGDFIVQTSKEAISLGLNLLHPKYFQTRGIEGDFEKWKDGFGFELPDIMAGLEFKRESLLSDIIKKLDDKNTNTAGSHTLLILGKSGTSKSTILMELICFYFKEQYIVLYNFGEEKIENVYGLVKFIEDKLEQGKVHGKENKILVAVDNVHNERVAPIFAVIDELDSHIKKDNLRFILCARQPEFDRFVEDRLSTVPGQVRDSINKLVKAPDIKFEIQPFDVKEIEDFIGRYKNELEIIDSTRRLGFQTIDLTNDKKIETIASEVYKETNGDPILVKFFLLGKGLLQDVKRRYDQYLSSMEGKLTSALVCSILNRTGLPITSTLTDCMNQTESVEELTGQTITFSEDSKTWKTIHPAWDLQLLTYLFTSTKEISTLSKRKRLMRNGINSLFTCLTSENDKYLILCSLYDSTTIETEEKKKLPIDIVEEVLTRPNIIADRLSDDYKVDLYTYYLGESFHRLQMYDDAIRYYDKALEINPNQNDAWSNKGVALGDQGHYDQAIVCYDKIIDQDPTHKLAWINKGNALDSQGHYDQAIVCYDKAIELDPSYKLAWLDKGVALHSQGHYDQAIVCYDKIIDQDPSYKDAWLNKGNALDSQGHYDQAIVCYDKAIELDPSYKDAWLNKGNALDSQGHYDQAIVCYDKAIELDPSYKDAWINKGLTLHNEGHYDQAIVCYDKAIELDPSYKDAWINKGLTLHNEGHYDQAIVCYDKAIELDPSYKYAWDNIGYAYYKKGDIDKAMKAVDKAIMLDPNYGNAWCNKSVYMAKKGNIDEAISYLKRAIELDKNNIEVAKTDTDFDSIRKDTRFIKLISS